MEFSIAQGKWAAGGTQVAHLDGCLFAAGAATQQVVIGAYLPKNPKLQTVMSGQAKLTAIRT